uniref:Cornifelin n=1 Tax=Magallana gigas TaxID=29159 RepID=K1RF92_MAGGI
MDGGHGFGHGKVGQEPGTGPQPVTQQPQQPPPGAHHYQPPGYPAPVHALYDRVLAATAIAHDCCNQPGAGCGVYWCGNGCYPCYLSSKLNESCCLPCCLPANSWLIALRVKMRAENNIQGSIMDDCCCVCCCPLCVMCQLSREHDYTLANPQTY